jgi:sulfoxide reductase heme-binding subunit YedZ
LSRLLKPVAFGLCLLPLIWLGWLAFGDGLGANPIERITRFLGDWALRLLLICLAVTPLVRFFSWNWLMRLRRMLGLFAFAYAVLHVSSYVGLDQFFAWRAIGIDIMKRNYITVGMLTFLLLLPLAATSTNGMIKRLGGKNWQRLHRLVYPAAILAVFHFAMMVKIDLLEPIIYGVILAILLLSRLLYMRNQLVSQRQANQNRHGERG